MILYKYYNAENGLKAIESRRLGFRSPEYFNDPFELTALSNGDGPGSKLDMLRQQVQQLKEHVVILSVSVRQTHLDHTILPRAPQNHAHLQGFSKRLVKSQWFGIRA
ncbi:hypothetical protein [Pseudomonas syringae]|uniref:hypothetical protein n=1 Tax=Pseudomonas syringae TaxID=317 RepID=UPI000A8F1862|nr:hypothetical protein [Pseudomonas syringae]